VRNGKAFWVGNIFPPEVFFCAHIFVGQCEECLLLGLTYGCAFLQRACPLWLRWLRGLLLMWPAFVRSCWLFPCISYGKKRGWRFCGCFRLVWAMHCLCIKVCRRGRLRRAAPHCRLLRTSAVDPEGTSMCSLEGWRVSLFSASSSMFWLFPPLPGAFVGDLAMCERKWMRGAWGRSQLLFSMG